MIRVPTAAAGLRGGVPFYSRLGIENGFWATGPFLVTLPGAPHRLVPTFSEGPYMASAWANLLPLMGVGFPIYMYM